MRIAMGLATGGTALIVFGLLFSAPVGCSQEPCPPTMNEIAVALGVIAVSAAVLRFGWLFAASRLPPGA